MIDPNAMEATLRPHRFTSDEYHAMAQYGILSPDARVELLDGQILEKMTIGNLHMAAVARLTRLLVRRFDDRAHVRVQGSILLSMFSEPEPDVLLLRKKPDDYAHDTARTEDIHAMIEVADSSLGLDQGKKLLIYAQQRVTEYWIVNLVDDRIEVYTEPHDLGYASAATFTRGESVTFLAFPDEPLPVEDILPPPKSA
jgi:Uma2 family endonuclease